MQPGDPGAACDAQTELPDIEDAFCSGSFFQDPHAIYRRLREQAPVYWSTYLGQWLVTSHEFVEEVLRQPRVYSNFGFDTAYIARLTNDDREHVRTLDHHFHQRGLIQADPPEHTRLRRALGTHFTAKVVGQLEDRIRAAIAEFLATTATDSIEVIGDLASPLPVRVIAELIGVEPDDRTNFPRWSADAVRFFGTPLPDAENARRLDSGLVEWRALLERLFDARRITPRNDLATVVTELIDEGSITLEEGLFTCVHLLIAGHETTTNLIGNALYCLLTHPEAMDAIAENPALLQGAIEEVLRFEPPIQRIRRLAGQTTELGGMTIRAGEPVIPVLAAANRDPVRFDDPDRFDISRDLKGSAQRHLSFGHGVHFCIGAPLALIEASAAVEAVIDRYPDAALPETFVPDWRRTINMRGLNSLPITSQRVALGTG